MRVGNLKHFSRRKDDTMARVLLGESCTARCVPKGTSCLFSPGNEVCCIFDQPEAAEIDLGMPIAGATGANLCRLFEHLKSRYSTAPYADCLCRKAVTIVNSRYNGHLPCKRYVEEIIKRIDKCAIILAFGRESEKFCDDIKQVNVRFFCEKKVIYMPHLSHEGLACISPTATTDKKCSAREKLDERKKLRLLARFISFCLREQGICGVFGKHEFEKIIKGYTFYKSQNRKDENNGIPQ